jgi:hypothetical protein
MQLALFGTNDAASCTKFALLGTKVVSSDTKFVRRMVKLDLICIIIAPSTKLQNCLGRHKSCDIGTKFALLGTKGAFLSTKVVLSNTEVDLS